MVEPVLQPVEEEELPTVFAGFNSHFYSRSCCCWGSFRQAKQFASPWQPRLFRLKKGFQAF